MQYEINKSSNPPILEIKGEIDLACSRDVRDLLLKLLAENQAFIVDMVEVTLIDSSGVAAFLEAFQEARRKGKKIVLASVGSSVMRVLRLARLEEVFPLASSVEEATRAIAEGD